MNLKENAFKSISKIKSILETEGISTSSVSEKIYNYEISLSVNKTSLKVQVYFGKKGVKTVIQGDSSSLAYNQIQNLIFDQPALNFSNKELSEPDNYIGSDECGKGDFFGPLVTAAAFVDSNTQKKLKLIGVRDSKDLSEPQIFDLASKIKKIIAGNYEVIKINPSKYNQLYEEFKNLNKLLNWAHSKAIDSLLVKTHCKTVITDKFSNKDLNVTSNINHSSVEFLQEHKAEKYIGVAAASILARDEFNKWFIHQKELGFTLPKGASDAVIAAASKLIKSIDENSFSNFAKLHFKTMLKIQKK